ncbi:hypothetical protein FB451DRAFT_1231718 [Mycena latifolia]|nr:hypothetical protein FB451DRAFT_1231718 [Mycena latifolia]
MFRVVLVIVPCILAFRLQLWRIRRRGGENRRERGDVAPMDVGRLDTPAAHEGRRRPVRIRRRRRAGRAACSAREALCLRTILTRRWRGWKFEGVIAVGNMPVRRREVLNAQVRRAVSPLRLDMARIGFHGDVPGSETQMSWMDWVAMALGLQM